MVKKNQKCTKDLYKQKHAKQKRWSTKVERRRLNWLGHLLRLPEEIPARQALHKALRKGKSKLTWLGLINRYL